MIRNLLENAVKYSTPGALIDIRATSADRSCTLSVANDTVAAIENLSELTGKFYREGGYQEGFGLGLWIVDQLAARNGGALLLNYEKPVFKATLVLGNG